MSKRKVILTHIGLFLVLSILHAYFAETLLKKFAHELNYVEVWIAVVKYGIISIFFILLASCLIFLYFKGP